MNDSDLKTTETCKGNMNACVRVCIATSITYFFAFLLAKDKPKNVIKQRVHFFQSSCGSRLLLRRVQRKRKTTLKAARPAPTTQLSMEMKKNENLTYRKDNEALVSPSISFTNLIKFLMHDKYSNFSFWPEFGDKKAAKKPREKKEKKSKT